MTPAFDPARHEYFCPACGAFGPTAADVTCTHCGPGTRAVAGHARRANEVDIDLLEEMVDAAFATHGLRSAEPHPLLRRPTPFGGPTPTDRRREERHLDRQHQLERERAANAGWRAFDRVFGRLLR